MLVQVQITLQLSVDSASNLVALTSGLNIHPYLLTHPNSSDWIGLEGTGLEKTLMPPRGKFGLQQ